MPALLLNGLNVRVSKPDAAPTQAERDGRNPCAHSTQGLNLVKATARAQALVDESTDNVVTASGTLDALRYGAILEARALVGLRGAGLSYDGFYYVQSVTHSIRKGEYKQNFTLTREGTGSTTPVVRP